MFSACEYLASSPGLQLCGEKAWYRLHAHARAFCKICRIRIRTDIVGLYVYGQFTAKCTENLAHAHAVDTRPSLRIVEGLGTRLVNTIIYLSCIIGGSVVTRAGRSTNDIPLYVEQEFRATALDFGFIYDTMCISNVTNCSD